MHIPTYLGLTVIGILSLSLAVSSLTLAQDPTREPPLDNVSPPLNTSSSSQVKAGGLSVGSLIVGAGEENVVIDSSSYHKKQRPTLSFPRIDTYTDSNGNTQSRSASLSRDEFQLNRLVRSSEGELLGTNSSRWNSSDINFQRVSGQNNTEVNYGAGGISLQSWNESLSRSFSLGARGLNFDFSMEESPTGASTHNLIRSSARMFEIQLDNLLLFTTPDLEDLHFTFLGIRREPSSKSSMFYMFSRAGRGTPNNYKARLGINTKDPRYPLDVVVSSTTTEPWVAGFGSESLVKIAADGRVAANQYCDSEGNNCLNPSDLEATIQNLQNRLESLENGG